MNTKALAILLVVFAISGAALLLTRQGAEITDSRQGSDNTVAQEDSPILPRQALDARLSEIDLYPYGKGPDAQARISLALSRGQWNVTAPHIFAADTQAINELLILLAGLKGSTASLPTNETSPLDTRGLALSLGGRETYTLTLGKRLGGGRAIIVVDSPGNKPLAYQADDTLHDLYDNFEPAVLYARSIIPPFAPEVGQIEITTPQFTSILTQRDGQWWIGRGDYAERALSETIDTYPGVQEMFNLFQAIELGPLQNQLDGLAAYGLDKPLVTARYMPIDNDGNNDWTFSVGVPADPADQARYVAWGPTGDTNPAVFTCPTPIALAFGQEATSFRDPRIFATPASLVDSIVLTSPTGEITLNTSLSRTALAKTLQTSAGAYLTRNTDNLEQLVIASLSMKIGNSEERITIYADPESASSNPTVLVQRGNEPVLLRVNRPPLKHLLDPSTLEQKQTH